MYVCCSHCRESFGINVGKGVTLILITEADSSGILLPLLFGKPMVNFAVSEYLWLVPIYVIY